MTTLYPMDFHRRVDRRWAERMNAATADSMAHARLAGQRRNEMRQPLAPGLVIEGEGAGDRGAGRRHHGAGR